MKVNITTAIRELSKLKAEIGEWNQRLLHSNLHRENVLPSYSYEECRENIGRLTKKILELKTKIAISNAKTIVKLETPIYVLSMPEGTKKFSVVELINLVAEIKGQISTLDLLQVQAAPEIENVEYTYSGVERIPVHYKMICHLTQRGRDDVLTQLKNDLSTINLAIEHSNHQTSIETSDNL